MANLRRPHSSLQGMSQASQPAQRSSRRWPVIVGALILALLVVAWIEGGEVPVRPIAEPIILPEHQT